MQIQVERAPSIMKQKPQLEWAGLKNEIKVKDDIND